MRHTRTAVKFAHWNFLLFFYACKKQKNSANESILNDSPWGVRKGGEPFDFPAVTFRFSSVVFAVLPLITETARLQS